MKTAILFLPKNEASDYEDTEDGDVEDDLEDDVEAEEEQIID